MKIEGITSIGLVRQNNQDRYASLNHASLDLSACIVCDGVGGSKAGEVAASLAVYNFIRLFTELKEAESLAQLKQWLKETVLFINERVYSLSQQQLVFSGMSTTMVILICSPFGDFYVNIGDSRLYGLDFKNHLIQLSSDDSVVNELIKQGTITKSQATSHPMRHAVTNAVGIYKEARMEIHDITLPVQLYLLSSDGLHGYVAKSTIQRILTDQSTTLRQKVIQLNHEAERRGGQDNITIILARKEDNDDHK
ncbi:MAG TPA: serine/threonine-protein phosphatase [Erysipelothrix sp.]|nr:serine/threonine-protein phosphatase [Erysipelothrix sp.]